MMETMDPVRPTGKTTSLMLKAIAAAIDAHGEWVQFIDHTGKADEYYTQRLKAMIKLMGLQMSVRRQSGRSIQLRSEMF
jgi:hypothetical protein